MGKCTACSRGVLISTTGVNPSSTLKIDIGGATLYVVPKSDGKIDVHVDGESLIDGDIALCTWDGIEWFAS